MLFSPILLATASGYTLPSNLGHATTSTGIGLVGLIVTVINYIIGIGGLLAIGLGIWRIIKLLIAQYQGKSNGNDKYTHGFIHENSLGTVPPMMKALLDILVGFIIIGIFMSGAWVTIIDHLIGIGSHFGNTLANHLGGSGTTGITGNSPSSSPGTPGT